MGQDPKNETKSRGDSKLILQQYEDRVPERRETSLIEDDSKLPRMSARNSKRFYASASPVSKRVISRRPESGGPCK